jgi:hypothetical protein
MTPIERCEHLKRYWEGIYKERYEEWKEAKAHFEHWSNELVKAEIAEQLTNEKS